MLSRALSEYPSTDVTNVVGGGGDAKTASVEVRVYVTANDYVASAGY